MQNEDSKNRRVAPRYRLRGMGSRSNNMVADVGGRSSHEKKEHSRSKASWIREYLRLAWNSAEIPVVQGLSQKQGGPTGFSVIQSSP